MVAIAREAFLVVFGIALTVACNEDVESARQGRGPTGDIVVMKNDAGVAAADASPFADASPLDAGGDASVPGREEVPDAAGGDAGREPTGPRVMPCSSPVVLDVTPGNARSVVESVSRDASANVRLNLAPGSYRRLSFDAPISCLEIRCAGAGECEMDGLRLDAWLSGLEGRPRYGTVIVEGLTFVGRAYQAGGSNDYGIAIYGVDQIRVQGNTFQGAFNHDISTKEAVTYAEVIDNTFVRCARHCIEVGQNGNVQPRPSTSHTLVVQGNTFDAPMINAITQRYNLNLTIHDNEFRDVAGNSLQHWPMWKPYVWNGNNAPAELNRIPRPARLRTVLTRNRFTGDNHLRLGGRGVIDDVVLIQGNTGSFSCQRTRMSDDEAEAHADEETREPPSIDPQSDVSC